MVLQHAVAKAQTGIEVGTLAAQQRVAQPHTAGLGLARGQQTGRCVAQPVVHLRSVHAGLHARSPDRQLIGQAHILQAAAFTVQAVQAQRVAAPQRVVPLHIGVGARHTGVAAAKVVCAQARAPSCAGLRFDHQV